MKSQQPGVQYTKAGDTYFEKRRLQKYAGVWSLWALGVGAVITGLCENVEYVLTPAVIVFFIGSYLTGIFETSAVFQPFWWIFGYIIFVGLNIVGVESGSAVIGGALLNMAVFAAMCSYIAPAISFILLRRNHAGLERPYRSLFGNPGAWVTLIIAVITIIYQLSDSTCRVGVIGVVIWFVAGISYFALCGRHHLILSPEEEFAMQHKAEDS